MEASGVIEQEDLGRECVDGIDDIVEMVVLEEGYHLVVSEECIERSDIDRRVDVAETLTEEVHLRMSHRGVESNELAVEVRVGHRIGIDDGKVAYACTAEHLSSVAPYSAQTHDEDTGSLEQILSLIA
jgi:hypothetical protein